MMCKSDLLDFFGRSLNSLPPEYSKEDLYRFVRGTVLSDGDLGPACGGMVGFPVLSGVLACQRSL